jgi:replicative DNA helicase
MTIMLEVLNAVETKEDYDKYASIVKKNTKDTDILRILKWVGDYYRDTGEEEVNWNVFPTYFFVNNPTLNTNKMDEYEIMFNRLALKSGSSLKNVLINTFLQRYHAERVGFIALEVAEGKRDDLTDIQKELDDYLTTSGKAEQIGAEANRKDLDELLAGTAATTGLSWRLDALNDSLGPLRKGNFTLFAGRPDSGKTTLLCSEGSFMAQQLPPNERLLYFTNEEGGDPVKIRMIQATLGMDYATIMKDPKRWWNEYLLLLGGDPDKILIIDKYDLHVKDIEWWLEHEEAGLIAIDQLRKVKGFEDIKGVGRLERLFNTGREWCKHFAPLVTVGQLGGQAEGIQYPGMSCLYESQTAIQGEMDGIITIGHIEGSIPPDARYLNVCKNKFPTPGDPSQRHGKHEVLLRADIARFV